jgi:hypothetical protein
LAANSLREDQIHGHLLVLLEVAKFSCLDYEIKIENYLSTYNLYYQEVEQSLNNLTTSLNSSIKSCYNLTNGIENTARTCEEMHSINLLKLLPDSSFDPFNSNDQFTFLFKSDKIKVNAEAEICIQIIAEEFDRILNLCLSIIKVLNLVNLNPSMCGVASSSSSVLASIPAVRCILNTILELLPRMARFNPNRFAQFYMKDFLQFLVTLYSNSQFHMPAQTSMNSATVQNLMNASGARRSQTSLSSSVTSLNSPTFSSASSSKTSMVPSNASFCFGTLKSQIIFCVGFMSLSLSSINNQDFNAYTKNYLELIRSSPLLVNKEAAAAAENFKGVGNSAEQINELNSIMASIAMLSNSITSEQKSKLNLVESIVSLLEPLMLCSGGITFTMRYFLNEITQYIPELKFVIHESLLKILAMKLTGLSQNQLIQTAPAAERLLTQNSIKRQVTYCGFKIVMKFKRRLSFINLKVERNI